MKIEILPRKEILSRLDRNSLERIRVASRKINNTLAIEDSWLEYAPKVNFWEWVQDTYDEKENMPIKQFAAFYFTLSQIRKDGIKNPIVLERYTKNTKGNKWFLSNGCHRMAIAEELKIEEIPVEWREN